MRGGKYSIFGMIVILLLLISSCATLFPAKEEAPILLPEEVPESVRPLFIMAEDALEGKQYDAALVLYGELEAQVEGGKVLWWAFLRKGQIYLHQGEYGKALRELDRVPKRREGDPLYNEARYFRALAYKGRGMLDAAESLTKELLKEPLTSRRKADIEYLRGDLFMEREAYDRALEAYVEALAEPASGELAGTLRGKIEDIARNRLTVKQREAALSRYQPDYPSDIVLLSLARSYLAADDLENARRAVEAFLSRHEGHPLFEEGRILKEEIEARASVRPFTIGCILPLTGEYAAYGIRALDAIVFAAGIFEPSQKSRVTLIFKDSRSDPGSAAAAVDRLAADNVIGIIGPLGSAPSRAAAERAQEAHVPILTLTQLDTVAETGDYVFRNSMTPRMQIQTLVAYAVDNLGMKSFAVLYPDDPSGIGMVHLFWDEIDRRGGRVRGIEGYAVDQTDFGEEIKALTGLDVLEEGIAAGEEVEPIIDFDALFVPDTAERISMIAPQLAFYDVTAVQLLGTSGWNDAERLTAAGDYLEGAIFTDGFFANSSKPEVLDFIDGFYAAFGREPVTLEALAFDATRIMIRVIEDRSVRSRRELKDALLNLERFDGVTGVTRMTPTGDTEKTLSILRVHNDEIVQVH